MIGRPPRRRRFDPVKAQLSNIQCIDEGIDHANRIALVNPVIEAFRQQRRLRPIRPCNEALHQFPRRIIRRILAAPAFSHTQGHERPFATALRRARMSLVSGLHHEKVIRRQSNTSAIPPIPTANKDRLPRLLCANERNRYRDSRCAGCLADSVATVESVDSGEGRATIDVASTKLLRRLNMSYDASAGRLDRQPLPWVSS